MAAKKKKPTKRQQRAAGHQKNRVQRPQTPAVSLGEGAVVLSKRQKIKTRQDKVSKEVRGLYFDKKIVPREKWNNMSRKAKATFWDVVEQAKLPLRIEATSTLHLEPSRITILQQAPLSNTPQNNYS